jgi:thiamine-phosphate pyrophosphorylase
VSGPFGIAQVARTGPFLYLILDYDLLCDRDWKAILVECLSNGVQVVQVRAKSLAPGPYRDWAAAVAAVLGDFPVIGVVNDAPDIAQAIGFRTVHVGQQDLSIAEVARRFPGLEIGVSATNGREAKSAEEAGAVYLGVGPINATTTKQTDIPPLGAHRLAQIASAVSIPVVAIGGLTPGDVEPLLKGGAAGVAVASAILRAPSPGLAVREFVRALRGG